MIYRYVSSKEMLAKVARDLKPDNYDWEQDVLEWIGEALEFIGSGAAYELKRLELEVFNYRALLPLDIRELKGVYTTEDKPYEYGNKEYADVPVATVARTNPLAILNSGTLVRTGSLVKYPKDGYFVNGGYLIMGFENGSVVIEYEGFKLDSDGFPMIPDAVHYRNAIFFYILRQMIMGGYKHSDNQMNYFNVDELWKKYCAQAVVKGGFPSYDKAMSVGKSFVSLLPVIRTNKPKLSDV
jgi:hypothetical protein